MAQVKLFAPEGTSSCSFAGDEYKVAADGTVEVPAAAIVALVSHGFLTTKPEPVPEPPPKAEIEKQLGAALQDGHELRGKIQALESERDELKVQLEAAKKRK